ncbi:MAG TPA: carboxypeptidase regulatory-like domain-containing protein [Candidatus Bipolaricaulota bacterium]|nr:carboxypeptidase regulatory-like domain-containing protein [Candidatus Bipolaricaulota bacterium]
MKKSLIISSCLFLLVFSLILPVSGSAQTMSERLSGKILLQVQNHGEAWYVNPADNKRIYLADGAAAYNLMRSLGIGITNADLMKIPLGTWNVDGIDADGDGLADVIERSLGSNPNSRDSDGDGYEDKTEVLNGYSPIIRFGNKVVDLNFANNQKGKIFLQVQHAGEAWYVNPSDGRRYYLGSADAAYTMMRKLGLGITNSDLSQISVNTGYVYPTGGTVPTPVSENYQYFTISGKVINSANGQPVPNILITNSINSSSDRTDVNGNYSLRIYAINGQSIRLTASQDNYNSYQKSIVLGNTNQVNFSIVYYPVEETVVKIPTASYSYSPTPDGYKVKQGLVSGFLIDKTTKKGIGNVMVGVAGEPVSFKNQPITDSNGYFSFYHVPGVINLYFSAKDLDYSPDTSIRYQVSVIADYRVEIRPEINNPTLCPTCNIPNFEYFLIRGKVTNSVTGQPIPAVEVAALQGNSRVYVRTDINGEYSFNFYGTRGKSLLIKAYSGNLYPAEKSIILGNSYRADFSLTPDNNNYKYPQVTYSYSPNDSNNGMISGRVIDNVTKQGIANVEITAASYMSPLVLATTDSNGYFQISTDPKILKFKIRIHNHWASPSGEYLVSVVPNYNGQMTLEIINDSYESPQITYSYSPNDSNQGMISGWVVDKVTKEGIGYVEIHDVVSPYKLLATTDSNGYFQFYTNPRNLTFYLSLQNQRVSSFDYQVSVIPNYNGQIKLEITNP